MTQKVAIVWHGRGGEIEAHAPGCRDIGKYGTIGPVVKAKDWDDLDRIIAWEVTGSDSRWLANEERFDWRAMPCLKKAKA